MPTDMLGDINTAKIVITNYHAFKLRDTLELSKGGRALLQSRGPEIQTLETEGQMLQRVMPSRMGMRDICILNDEAHHCYREKPRDAEEDDDEGEHRTFVTYRYGTRPTPCVMGACARTCYRG